MAVINPHTTRATGTVLTAAIYNADHQNHITNCNNLNAAPGSFPAGTRMLFIQTAAPPAWTKETTNDNKALRIVSGSAGTGGTVDFTTAFASQAVAGNNSAYALAAADLPVHTHTQQGSFVSGGRSAAHTHTTTGSTSVSGAHNHGFDVWSHADTGSNVAGTVARGGDNTHFNANEILTSSDGTHSHSLSLASGTESADHTHTTTISGQTGSIGGGGTHTHTFTGTAINLAVKYVDAIICSKD